MMRDVVVMNRVYIAYYIALSNDVLVCTVRSASIGICVFFSFGRKIPAPRMTSQFRRGWNLVQTSIRTPPRSGGKCGAFGTGVSWWPAGGGSGVVDLSHTYPTQKSQEFLFVWCSYTDCGMLIFKVHVVFQMMWSFSMSCFLRWFIHIAEVIFRINTLPLCVLGHFVPCAKEHSTAVADVACWPECVNSPVSEAGVWDGCWGSPARLWHC